MARPTEGELNVRYFVTGAAGFIGSHFVRQLLGGAYGPDVTGVTVYDKLTYAGNPANLASVAGDPRYSFVKGDICDGTLLDSVLPGHDIVVNFAAETHVDRSISGPQEFLLTNVVGAQTLFDACLRHGIPRTVHIGTDEVYGSIDEGSWTESEPLLPNSPYSAAKAAAEMLVRAYHVTYGLNISSTRCSNNYGPFQFPEKLIPLFVTNLIDGRKDDGAREVGPQPAHHLSVRMRMGSNAVDVRELNSVRREKTELHPKHCLIDNHQRRAVREFVERQGDGTLDRVLDRYQREV